MTVSETSAAFASHAIAKLLERLAYQVSATAHSPNTDKVHDLRVAVRRFEQSLVTLRDALPSRELKRVRRKLKAIMQRAGAVRDADVIQKLLTKCEDSSVAQLKGRLAEQRKSDVPALTAVLRRWGARRTSSKWRAALLPIESHDSLHLHLPKLARKFLAHGEAATEPKVSAEHLHAFRIEAKKFRYTLEFLEPLHGPAIGEWLNRLKPVQSALGDIHDAWMARSILAPFDPSAEIEAWLKKRQRKKTREFRGLWQESFGSAAETRRLIDALRHTPRKPMGRSTASASAAARQA